jgi:catechol 2,3-dioxygenase-like lactoylglutathione lyase family enzyme
VLGRFLEVSVAAADVPASLAFYESLGFVQAPTGDARRWPYAVVTDGRLSLGLHAAGVAEPTLTWVRPAVALHAERIESLGIELEYLRLGPEELHEIGFRDPSGQLVSIVEARTFSPPSSPPPASQLGWFEEFGVPTTDLARSASWWDALGLVAFEPVNRPFPRASAAARDLNLGLYDIDLRAPVLVYSDPAMPARIAELRERGHRFAPRLPRGLDPHEHALLEAPEGTWLLLATGLE